MPVIDSIAGFHGEMTAWRRDLHAHPETAFEEERTSAFIAGKLEEFGLKVHRGLAGTGVVGILSSGEGASIGLRSDMDALNMSEANTFAHASVYEGKMHACGHDGHVAILLGAARYLAESGNFSGAIHFIFQPAEENEGGGRRMVEEGLFEKFPMDAVFGLHNWPQMAAGRFAAAPGPMMASVDSFELLVKGKGAHAAMPSQGIDALAAAAFMVEPLRALSCDSEDTGEASVVTVTRLNAGAAVNVVAERGALGGTVRCFSPAVQDAIEASMHDIACRAEAAYGVSVEVSYRRRYPPTVNHPGETALALEAAVEVAGPGNIERAPRPSMGGEDFSFMLQKVAGCYMWIGSAHDGAADVLHNTSYDFNDDILPHGASYWVRLAEKILG